MEKEKGKRKRIARKKEKNKKYSSGQNMLAYNGISATDIE